MKINGLETIKFKSIDELNNLQIEELEQISQATWTYQKRVDAVLRLQKELEKEE